MKSQMTDRDYELIALAVYDASQEQDIDQLTISAVIDKLAIAIHTENPNFKVSKFWYACINGSKTTYSTGNIKWNPKGGK